MISQNDQNVMIVVQHTAPDRREDLEDGKVIFQKSLKWNI